MFFFGITTQVLGTLITRIMAHYDIRMAQAGLLSSFISTGNLAAMFVVSVFVGRINKMVLLGASFFLFSASLFLISIAPPFGILLAGFALTGVFGATIDTLNNSLIADLMPAKISLGMSLLHGIFGLGGLCSPIIIESLAWNLGWKQVYVILSAVFILDLAIYSLYTKLQWNHLVTLTPNKKQAGFGLTDMVQFFRKKQHVLLWLAMFFYGGNQSTLAVWIKRYVETHINEPAWGAYVLSAMWIGITISRLVISPFVKISSTLKICTGNIISAITLAAGLLLGTVGGIMTASFAVGLASGLTIPLIIAIGCEWHRERTAYGTMMPFTALFISYLIFPPLSGLASDMLGIPWGVALGALSALLTAVFSGALERWMKREKEEAILT